MKWAMIDVTNRTGRIFISLLLARLPSGVCRRLLSSVTFNGSAT